MQQPVVSPSKLKTLHAHTLRSLYPTLIILILFVYVLSQAWLVLSVSNTRGICIQIENKQRCCLPCVIDSCRVFFKCDGFETSRWSKPVDACVVTAPCCEYAVCFVSQRYRKILFDNKLTKCVGYVSCGLINDTKLRIILCM